MNIRDPLFQETTTRFGVLRLHVEVADGVLAIRLTPVQRSGLHLPLREVVDARVTDYSPREHGGGIGVSAARCEAPRCTGSAAAVACP